MGQIEKVPLKRDGLFQLSCSVNRTTSDIIRVRTVCDVRQNLKVSCSFISIKIFDTGANRPKTIIWCT